MGALTGMEMPTMSGIMSGAYYLRNSHNPSSRLPRQEVLTLLALLVQKHKY